MEGPTKGGSQRETAGGEASEGPESVEKTSEEMRPHMKNGKRQQIKKKKKDVVTLIAVEMVMYI